MTVVIDNNRPCSLARLLSQKDIEAIHVVDQELSDVSNDYVTKDFFNAEYRVCLS